MRNNELHLRDKDSERGDQTVLRTQKPSSSISGSYSRVMGGGTRRLTDGLVMRMQRYGCSTGLSW